MTDAEIDSIIADLADRIECGFEPSLEEGDRTLAAIKFLRVDRDAARREAEELRTRNADLALELRGEKLKKRAPPSALLARAEAAEARADKLAAELDKALLRVDRLGDDLKETEARADLAEKERDNSRWAKNQWREWAESAKSRNDAITAAARKACEAIDKLLACPEIADSDPRDKDEETHEAERLARAARAGLAAAIASSE